MESDQGTTVVEYGVYKFRLLSCKGSKFEFKSAATFLPTSIVPNTGESGTKAKYTEINTKIYNGFSTSTKGDQISTWINWLHRWVTQIIGSTPAEYSSMKYKYYMSVTVVATMYTVVD